MARLKQLLLKMAQLLRILLLRYSNRDFSAGCGFKTLDDKDFQVVMEGGKVSFERKRVSTGLNDVHGELFGDIKATYDGSGKMQMDSLLDKNLVTFFQSIRLAKIMMYNQFQLFKYRQMLIQIIGK